MQCGFGRGNVLPFCVVFYLQFVVYDEIFDRFSGISLLFLVDKGF